jgi:transcriptional regulator GlxA family with amidase domain
VRTLQRRFRSNLGVSPKWVLGRFRLQEAALALEQDPDVDLAALAVRLGWYDQAHLTNAFRRLLGETPAQYAGRARPSS